MRLIGSRAYTRPTPVPKMPPGLVELMEGLTKDVLKNNPDDIYEFCTNHTKKLLEIRDGHSSKRSLTLEQKISKAQDIVRKRAEKRRQKYDKEITLRVDKQHDTPISDETEKHSTLSNIKNPVYQKKNLAECSEIEISHKSGEVLNSTDSKDGLHVKGKENLSDRTGIQEVKTVEYEKQTENQIDEMHIEPENKDVVVESETDDIKEKTKDKDAILVEQVNLQANVNKVENIYFNLSSEHKGDENNKSNTYCNQVEDNSAKFHQEKVHYSTDNSLSVNNESQITQNEDSDNKQNKATNLEISSKCIEDINFNNKHKNKVEITGLVENNENVKNKNDDKSETENNKENKGGIEVTVSVENVENMKNKNDNKSEILENNQENKVEIRVTESVENVENMKNKNDYKTETLGNNQESSQENKIEINIADSLENINNKKNDNEIESSQNNQRNKIEINISESLEKINNKNDNKIETLENNQEKKDEIYITESQNNNNDNNSEIIGNNEQNTSNINITERENNENVKNKSDNSTKTIRNNQQNTFDISTTEPVENSENVKNENENKTETLDNVLGIDTNYGLDLDEKSIEMYVMVKEEVNNDNSIEKVKDSSFHKNVNDDISVINVTEIIDNKKIVSDPIKKDKVEEVIAFKENCKSLETFLESSTKSNNLENHTKTETSESEVFDENEIKTKKIDVNESNMEELVPVAAQNVEESISINEFQSDVLESQTLDDNEKNSLHKSNTMMMETNQILTEMVEITDKNTSKADIVDELLSNMGARMKESVKKADFEATISQNEKNTTQNESKSEKDEHKLDVRKATFLNAPHVSMEHFQPILNQSEETTDHSRPKKEILDGKELNYDEIIHSNDSDNLVGTNMQEVQNEISPEISESCKIDNDTISMEQHDSTDDTVKALPDDNVMEFDMQKSLDETMPTNIHNPNTMDLETAAITIQKVFRSFLFKSRASTLDDVSNDDINVLDEDLENEKKDENEIQIAIGEVNKERRTLGINRMDTVLQTVNEEKSLSLSTDDSSTLSSAATIIQKHVRGFLVRTKLNSNKTSSTTNSLFSPSTTSSDIETNQQKNKTVLNIHIVPEGENFLSRDESMATSIDLPLDGSPLSSINLHPLGYDKSEPRKQLKREDAVQSISPPSNNSGKLSEDVDSVREILTGENEHSSERQETNDSSLKKNELKSDLENSEIINKAKIENFKETQQNPLEILSSSDSLTEVKDEKFSKNFSSDEMDVVTPSRRSSAKETNNALKLLHSGEFHDVVLPTKVLRGETSVVREFKNAMVYLLLWNNY